MSLCWKCNSQLLRTYGEWHCRICGATQKQATEPIEQEDKKRSYEPRKVRSQPKSWVSEKLHKVGPVPIRQVRQLLNKLPPPFLRSYPDKSWLAGLRRPCFYFDREFAKEQAKLVGYKRPKHWKVLQKKADHINKRLHGLSESDQRIAKMILWLCDESTRQKFLLEDCTVQWFIRVIESEEKWLELFRQLVQVRRLWNRTSLLEEKLSASVLSIDHDLFKTTLFDVQIRALGSSNQNDPREKRFGQMQREIDKARKIVTRAAAILEPAKTFYASAQPPKSVKRVLLDLMVTLFPNDKKRAAARVVRLLHIADPKRRMKASSIRQIHYGR
mgnify:CR=1 FL=1